MSVFFDTNVVLEYLLDRRNSDVVEQVLSYLKRVNSLKYLSSGSFYTLVESVVKRWHTDDTDGTDDRRFILC